VPASSRTPTGDRTLLRAIGYPFEQQMFEQMFEHQRVEPRDLGVRSAPFEQMFEQMFEPH
jgi:hypothetical protein